MAVNCELLLRIMASTPDRKKKQKISPLPVASEFDFDEQRIRPDGGHETMAAPGRMKQRRTSSSARGREKISSYCSKL